MGWDLPQRLLEIARTDLAPRRDETQEPEPNRIRQRAKHLGELLRVGFAQRRRQQRPTTPTIIKANERPLRGSQRTPLPPSIDKCRYIREDLSIDQDQYT